MFSALSIVYILIVRTHSPCIAKDPLVIPEKKLAIGVVLLAATFPDGKLVPS